MPKILVIGPEYYGYNEAIASAFEESGWDTFCESFIGPVHPFRGLLKWRHKFSLNRKKLKENNLKKYNNYLIQKHLEIKPDLVFILNGHFLSIDTLTIFKQSSKTVLWMYDSITRYTECKDFIDHVDYLFCYDQNDVKLYAEQNKKAYFLPQAYNNKLYKNLNLDKDIDILFVGVLYTSMKRISYVKNVIKNFPDKKILIFGTYKPYYKNIIKWIFREKRNIYMNKNIPSNLVNEYYNRSKIVLNIHHETQTDGANPKVFEICGSGAYQICDSNPYIRSLFKNEEIGLYNNEKELIECINDAFNNDKSKNAEIAHCIVSNEHTFKHRVKEVISVVYD